MNNWNWILESPLILSLGWSVLHSIWQVLLLGAVAFFSLKLIPTQKAEIRYLFSYTLLLIIGGLFIWNFNYQYQNALDRKIKIALISSSNEISETELSPNTSSNSIQEPLITGEPEPESLLNRETEFFSFAEILSSAKHFFIKSLPWLAMIWIAGVFFLGLKLVGGWWYLKYQVRRTAKPVASQWQNKLDRLKNQLGIRASIQLLESTNISTPLTFGWLKPVILIPFGILSQLPPDQVEAVLLHELAHIRRFDFLANIVQTLIEILLFFHPVVWWISREIRESRENCCDDIAATHCKNRLHYAVSLLQLQKYSFTTKNQLAMAATGNSGRLTARIQRLFTNTETENQFSNKRMSPLLSLLLIFSFLSLYAFTDLFSIANKTVSISADKMNVFYIGVDNPVTAAVAGIPAEKIRLSSNDVILENRGDGHYNVKASESGNAIIQVSGEGLETTDVTFRIKQLPDPVAMLNISGNLKSGGTVPAEEFQKVKEVEVSFKDFDFDVNMKVIGFHMTRVGKNEDPVEATVVNGNFTEKVKDLIEMAKPGDIYYFDKVQVKWMNNSGNNEHEFEPINVNSMVFKMK